MRIPLCACGKCTVACTLSVYSMHVFVCMHKAGRFGDRLMSTRTCARDAQTSHLKNDRAAVSVINIAIQHIGAYAIREQVTHQQSITTRLSCVPAP